MFDHARRAAQIVGAGYHLPALARGGGEKAVDLRAVADPVQQSLAAMDDEIIQAGAVVGEAVGLVENAGEKDFRHTVGVQRSRQASISGPDGNQSILRTQTKMPVTYCSCYK